MRRAREKDGAHEIHGILIRHPARVPKTNPRRSEPASAYLGQRTRATLTISSLRRAGVLVIREYEVRLELQINCKFCNEFTRRVSKEILVSLRGIRIV